MVIGLDAVVELNHVGVGNALKDADLSLEIGQKLGGQQGARNSLDGDDRPGTTSVTALANGGKAALANLGGRDNIAPHALLGREQPR